MRDNDEHTGDLFGAEPPQAPVAPRQHQPRRPPKQAGDNFFFAVRPGAMDAERIAALAGGLRASHGVHGRSLIAPERMHITLVPIDDNLGAARLDAARRAADTVRVSAMDICFDTVATFNAGAFVLFGGQGLDAVRNLRLDLGCALADQGFKPQIRYEPHMTLCYDRRLRLARTPVDPIRFHVTEFVLIKSYATLSRHEVLHSWPLSG